MARKMVSDNVSHKVFPLQRKKSMLLSLSIVGVRKFWSEGRSCLQHLFVLLI